MITTVEHKDIFKFEIIKADEKLGTETVQKQMRMVLQDLYPLQLLFTIKIHLF